jgi:hypothetical protein
MSDLNIQMYSPAAHPDCPHAGHSDNCPCTPGGATILVNGNEALTIAQAAEVVPIRGAGGSPYSVVSCDDSNVQGVYRDADDL